MFKKQESFRWPYIDVTLPTTSSGESVMLSMTVLGRRTPGKSTLTCRNVDLMLGALSNRLTAFQIFLDYFMLCPSNGRILKTYLQSALEGVDKFCSLYTFSNVPNAVHRHVIQSNHSIQ